MLWHSFDVMSWMYESSLAREISECEPHIASIAGEKIRAGEERKGKGVPEQQASFAGPPCRAGKWDGPRTRAAGKH